MVGASGMATRLKLSTDSNDTAKHSIATGYSSWLLMGGIYGGASGMAKAIDG